MTFRHMFLELQMAYEILANHPARLQGMSPEPAPIVQDMGCSSQGALFSIA
jgi:hypothetical protein